MRPVFPGGELIHAEREARGAFDELVSFLEKVADQWGSVGTGFRTKSSSSRSRASRRTGFTGEEVHVEGEKNSTKVWHSISSCCGMRKTATHPH